VGPRAGTDDEFAKEILLSKRKLINGCTHWDFGWIKELVNTQRNW